MIIVLVALQNLFKQQFKEIERNYLNQTLTNLFNQWRKTPCVNIESGKEYYLPNKEWR
jgi:hypothetical protein